MYSLFWKSLFSSIWLLVLVANIAFTFNLVNIINPSSLDIDYSGYYLGMSSFIDSFKAYFGNNPFINGFYSLIMQLGNLISKFYTFYSNLLNSLPRLFGWKPEIYEIITGIIALVMFASNAIPLLLMLIMGALYIVYLCMFAFQIILFIVAFLGGSFATPLPSTDWWDTGVITTPVVTDLRLITAIMV